MPQPKCWDSGRQAVARPISQYLSQSYKSSLPNSLNYFILYWIESVQLENLLRIGVRKEEGAWSDLLTCSDSKRFKDDKMKRNENNGWFWGRCSHLWFQRRVRLVSKWIQNHKHSGRGKKEEICTERFAPLGTLLFLLLYFLLKPPTISLIKKDNFYSSTIS